MFNNTCVKYAQETFLIPEWGVFSHFFHLFLCIFKTVQHFSNWIMLVLMMITDAVNCVLTH